MASFWKIVAPVACVTVVCGTAVLWRLHNEKANRLRLVEAARVCRLDAEQGDAKAQNRLGHMYYHGQGVPQDYAEAVRWYRKAADQGDAKGEYGLGYMYYHGQSVPQDYTEAARWYRKAADQGDASAEINLAAAYYYGQGVPQDYAEAVRWYRKAADQGDAKGQDGLGYMYYHGQGVAQDYAEAARWYREAADQGLARAQYELGLMYYYGQGVPQDRAAANRWFAEAAHQGNESARRALGVPLTTRRKFYLLAQVIGGILLTSWSLLMERGPWSLRRAVSTFAGVLCLFTAGLSWYGYTHYLIWCKTCGFSAFTLFKWLLGAVLIALLVYIVRPAKKELGHPSP